MGQATVKKLWPQFKHTNEFLTGVIKSKAALCSSLVYLVVDNYVCGKIHHILMSCRRAREVHRVHTKLKIATGTNILQKKRASFNQNEVGPHMYDVSRRMGKPTICIGENKGADQLLSYCEADQRLYFRYTYGTIPLLSKSKISSL